VQLFRARGRGSSGPRPSTPQWRGGAPQVVAKSSMATRNPMTTTALAVTNKAVTRRRAYIATGTRDETIRLRTLANKKFPGTTQVAIVSEVQASERLDRDRCGRGHHLADEQHLFRRSAWQARTARRVRLPMSQPRPAGRACACLNPLFNSRDLPSRCTVSGTGSTFCDPDHSAVVGCQLCLNGSLGARRREPPRGRPSGATARLPKLWPTKSSAADAPNTNLTSSNVNLCRCSCRVKKPPPIGS
jgi:hypothetical protein